MCWNCQFSVSTIAIGANCTSARSTSCFTITSFFDWRNESECFTRNWTEFQFGDECWATCRTAPQVEKRLSRTLTSRVEIRFEYILGARRPLAPIAAIGTFYCFPTLLWLNASFPFKCTLHVTRMMPQRCKQIILSRPDPGANSFPLYTLPHHLVIAFGLAYESVSSLAFPVVGHLLESCSVVQFQRTQHSSIELRDVYFSPFFIRHTREAMCDSIFIITYFHMNVVHSGVRRACIRTQCASEMIIIIIKFQQQQKTLNR